MTQPAVFLDRDDTLIVDSGYIDDPGKVRLMPGAAAAVRRLNDAGYVVVVATNQSGIARGYFDEARLDEIHQRMTDLLAAEGAMLDGIYYCPFLDSDEAQVERFRGKSELRKPAPGMLLKAAADHDLDLSRSWMIGDGARDIEAGVAAGCRTIHININGHGLNGSTVRPTFEADSLPTAVALLHQADKQLDPLLHERGEDESTIALLTDIRNLLDRQQRTAIHDDFSILRLLATVLQMLTLVVGIWGVIALFAGDDGHALVRFALAGLLPLSVISLMLTNARK